MQMPPLDPAILARRSEIVAALRAIVPGEGVIDDLDGMRPYECDALSAYRQMPLVVVLPENVAQVSAILKYCQDSGVKVVPHSPFTGPALVATVHLIAAMGEDIPCEHRFCDLEASPIGDCVRAFNGRIAVPQGPGLGFEVDQKIIAKYRKDV